MKENKFKLNEEVYYSHEGYLIRGIIGGIERENENGFMVYEVRDIAPDFGYGFLPENEIFKSRSEAMRVLKLKILGDIDVIERALSRMGNALWTRQDINKIFDNHIKEKLFEISNQAKIIMGNIKD